MSWSEISGLNAALHVAGIQLRTAWVIGRFPTARPESAGAGDHRCGRYTQSQQRGTVRIHSATQLPMSTGSSANAPATSTSVAVRVLCQFTAKRGDLDLRFTPAPSAREGIAGHQIVAARRGREYETEVTLEGTYESLRVRGRADGYDNKERRLDECKTYRGDLARMPDNHRALHWAQAKMYGALLCRKQQLRELRVALVYYDVDSEHETVLAETFSAEALQVFFDEHCALYAHWARSEL